ncbi:MAG: electron transfer flavoprotein subunit alpha/FixB family protein [Bdellovibrionaceae bacterium]|nr:electron transfer flavoprotein subunit alpha/FixB family protein [Bdellovibrionales bacterium]MCB9085436.1 electron transfer flavoprotein subunit alpha/FixB family protein [Pseudobdellovibrionaceae bacterium]
MSSVLVFCEHQNGNLKKGAMELLTAATTSGLEVHSLVVGPGAKDIANQTFHYGATKAFVCESGDLTHYNSELYTSLMEKALQASNPNVLLASSSMLARDLFPRVSARVNSGIVSDCTELSFSGGDVVVRKPMYAAKCTAGVEFKNSPVKMVLMRPNQLPVGTPDAGKSGEIVNLELAPIDLKTLIKEVVKGTSEKLDLTEANIIVSGGRGLKEKENFKLLEDLAEVLGATVGASRAVVDTGWVPHGMQVGQTGKTVAPSLYIAVGISGAIQHLAGMTGSKVIVAVNKDPEAPIFQKATYGIVGDLFDVVPKLTEEFRKALH